MMRASQNLFWRQKSKILTAIVPTIIHNGHENQNLILKGFPHELNNNFFSIYTYSIYQFNNSKKNDKNFLGVGITSSAVNWISVRGHGDENSLFDEGQEVVSGFRFKSECLQQGA